ncbi:TIM-barrel domain-containing protein [Flavobacteriaceae bacterium SZ-1-7]|uniref:TIM-barrel domain-containing protein n=1 Tax=Tamlana sedimenti TaxID=3134126 RepID=UPI00312A8847
MKYLQVSLSITLLFICLAGRAQTYERTVSGIKTKVNTIMVELEFYGPSTIRVVKYPEGKVFSKESLSVIQSPEKVKFSVQQQDDLLMLDSREVKVYLNLINGQISFKNKGKTLLSENENGASFVDFVDAGSKTYSITQSFVLDPEEFIYGLGQQQEGLMSKRGVELTMIQGNTEDYIPFFISNKGYGVFWDNYSPTTFKDTPSNTYFKSDVGDGIDYYFMAGGNADDVITCMRNLTGQAPMYPLWTFGFWQSRERYKSQDELVGVVKKFRELGVPLDGIIQDWQYWGNNYQWNAMDFVNPGFQQPQKMVNDVHELNAHMIISIWNSFGPMTKQYKELDSINALFSFETWPSSGYEAWPPRMDYPSGVRVYDAYNPKARNIYWKYLDKGLFSLGIDGWWIDSSEPDHLNPQPEDFDTETYLGSFRKVRNAFPLMTVGGVAEHQLAETKDKRLFILTRSAFAGQQRYGANLWSGDVVASWEALRNQISAGLNVSLSGLPYWNSDIGGFFLWDFNNPLNNPDYRELHVRWIEFGTFCPMMRSHGEGYPREIYQFGEKGNPTYDAIEKYINLRYSLLPYIYSTSWDVTTNHSSMMRALMMDFASDKNALDIDDEFMFGPSLLINPVTEAMYWKNKSEDKNMGMVEDFSVVKAKEVYLPEGSDWFDFWTGEKFNGGQNVKKEVPLDIIPIYVKEGSILPWGPEVQFATEKSWDTLEIRIYEGADGQFTLYEDENDNYNYESGKYSTISFKWNDNKKMLTIDSRKGYFPGMISNRKFNVKFVSENKGTGIGLSKEYDLVINYSGKKMSFKK